MKADFSEHCLLPFLQMSMLSFARQIKIDNPEGVHAFKTLEMPLGMEALPIDKTCVMKRWY